MDMQELYQMLIDTYFNQSYPEYSTYPVNIFGLPKKFGKFSFHYYVERFFEHNNDIFNHNPKNLTFELHKVMVDE